VSIFNENTDDIYCLNDMKTNLNFKFIHFSRVLFELETPVYTAVSTRRM